MKKSKSALLSTYKNHHEARGYNGGEGKPELILDYKRTKGGVDAFDMMMAAYSSKQISRRWQMQIILFWMLDTAGSVQRFSSILFPLSGSKFAKFQVISYNYNQFLKKLIFSYEIS